MNRFWLSDDNRKILWKVRIPAILLFLAVNLISCGGGGGGGGGSTNSPPSVLTLPVDNSSITVEGAVLKGTVNPHALVTSAWFEWGTDPNLPTFTTTTPESLAAGTADLPVSYTLAGRNPGTTYYYRAVASNADGRSEGAILSFRTLDPPPLLPVVTTGDASSITLINGDVNARVTLNGTVNPNGSETTAWFEYGTDPALSSWNTTATRAAGSGTTVQQLGEPISTLQPWRTYYFRTVATSTAGGPVKGTIQQFQTGDYYVAFGDSITWGSMDDVFSDDTSLDGRNSGGGYEPILNDLLTGWHGYPHTVVNEGLSGDTAEGGMNRIQSVLNAHPRAKYILIMFGTNDASFPYPSGLGEFPASDNSFKANIQEIIWAVEGAGKTPYLAKIPYTKFTARNPTIQEYNDVIDELVSENFIAVVPPDFYSWFEANKDTQLADDVHPNGLGYQSMADRWFGAFIP